MIEYILIIIFISGFALIYFKKTEVKDNPSELLENKIAELEKENIAKDENIKHLQTNIEIANAKMISFEQIKTEKIQIEERLKNTENQRNSLQNKFTSLESKDLARNESLIKSIDKSNALQDSLEKEKERLSDERVLEKSLYFEKMKKKWGKRC